MILGRLRSLLCGSAAALALSSAACSRRESDWTPGSAPSAAPVAKATGSNTAADRSNADAGAVAVLHAIDVGTGLAIFIEGPDFALLYDGGSNDDLRDERSNRLIAYLRAVHPGLRRIDHLVLSHAHRDHVELLPDVVDEYEVGDVWEPGVVEKICAYERFVHAIAMHPGIRYHTAAHPAGTGHVTFPAGSCRVPSELDVTYASPIEEGRPLRLGADATIAFLHVDGARHANVNDSSLVARVTIGDRSVLLMGDAEAGRRASPEAAPEPESVEAHVLARHRSTLRSDVLVVGHHGSKTSTRLALLDAVSPRIAIVSSGPHAYATHVLPDPEVVQLLSARAALFRTDLDDDACLVAPAKIGKDADRRPGGCDNVQVTFRPGAEPHAAYWRGSD